MSAPRPEPIIVKRYANRRLYDTAEGRYVGLKALRDWAAKGIGFVVLDRETGQDVTRILLAQAVQ